MKRSANAEMQIGVELAVTEEAVGTYLLGALLVPCRCLASALQTSKQMTLNSQLICSVLQIPMQYNAL